MTENEMIITVTMNPARDKVLVVPDFRAGRHVRAEVRSFLPAGKGVNVARGIARMGGRAGVGAFMARNAEEMFRAGLVMENIEARFHILSSGDIRTNITVLDPNGPTTTHLREPGPEVSPDDLAGLCTLLADWLSELPQRPTLAFAGSLPPNMTAEDFARVLRAAADCGARIVVDTNGPALRAAYESGVVHTLKPNIRELAECMGRSIARDDAPAAAAELLDKVSTVLVTMSEHGAWAVQREGMAGRRCRLAESELKSTVGCGDAFLAGWLVGRQRTDDLGQRLCWAVAAGAASAVSETVVGYALADVESLAARCEELPAPQPPA